MRENIYGPENRISKAKLSTTTVRATSSYANGKATGTLLSVKASSGQSDVAYRNIRKVASDTPAQSLAVSVVPEMGAEAKLSVGKSTVKALSLKGRTDRVPADVYRAYCTSFLPAMLGAGAYTLQNRSTVSITGNLERLYDSYDDTIYPDITYDATDFYSSLTTGVPLCNGGLGTTTAGHDYRYGFGESYDYAADALGTVHTEYARAETVTALRYDTEAASFVVEHTAVCTEGGLRPVSTDSENVQSTTFGSYGTFNSWDTCTYPQNFTRITTTESSTSSYVEEDSVHLAISESKVEEDGVFAIRATVTFDEQAIGSSLDAGVFPCSVEVVAGEWTVRLSGSFDSGTMKLSTEKYNPLGVSYPAISDAATPASYSPLDLYRSYHTTMQTYDPPVGFYYCYAAKAPITILENDVLAVMSIPERGALVTSFRVSLPAAMTSRYFIRTASMSSVDRDKSLLKHALDPHFIDTSGLTEGQVEVYSTLAVLNVVNAASTVRYAHFCRAADLGRELISTEPLADQLLYRTSSNGGTVNVTGVPIYSVTAEDRGSKHTVSRQEPGWLAMAPYGFEGYGSGVTSSIVTNTPDPTVLVWSNTATYRVDRLEYKDYCKEYSSVESKVGTYTNSYARPIDTVTDTYAYDIKATVVGGGTILYPGTSRPFSVSIPPKTAKRVHHYTDTSPAEVGAKVQRVGTDQPIPATSKEIVLCDSNGGRLTLLRESFSGMSVAYESLSGAPTSFSVVLGGTTSASCPTGDIDPRLLYTSSTQKGAVGVCAEAIGLVSHAFIVAGGSILCKSLPAECSPAFPAPVPPNSPYGVRIEKVKRVSGYNSNMGMVFTLNDYYNGDYQSPSGWEIRIVDSVSGYVAKVVEGNQYGLEVGFPLDLWAQDVPPSWYCLVAPYCLSGGKRYYGSDVFTGPTLGFPTGLSYVGGITLSRTHTINRVTGENGYYGGSPSWAIPAAQDNEYTREIQTAYLDTYPIPPTIGVDLTAQLWSVGEASRYVPFVWFSNISGAEGYCVGARAASIATLPTLFSKVRVKSTAAEILTVVETEKNSNDSVIASLVATGGTGEANLAKIADLRDFATILGTLVSAVRVMVEEEEEEVRVAAEEERDPVPLDMDRVYSVFIDTANSRVILLRNDFASPELLFAVAQDKVGCGFVQQAPSVKEAVALSSVWR